MTSQYWLRQRRWTTLIIYIAGVLERADEQLLPTLYRNVKDEFHTTIEALGDITMARSVIQALSAPVGGIAGMYYDRTKVLTIGCFVWGLMAILFGLSSKLIFAGVVWACNGMGLALVVPNSQSIIADFYSSQERGKAFGALQCVGALGAMLGILFGSGMADYISWRGVFFIFGAISLCIGVAMAIVAKDPKRDDKLACHVEGVTLNNGQSSAAQRKGKPCIKDIVGSIWSVLKVPTFLVIVGQGILGSAPWAALLWFVFYLQMIGMSHIHAGIVTSLFLGAQAVGASIGGYLGDRAAVMSPNHGRIYVCQFSVFIGVPGVFILLKGMPLNGDTGTVVLYGALVVVLGLMSSWAAPACNNPIFAEIVPADKRELVYAFDRCFEAALAAIGAPVVAYIATDWYGYKQYTDQDQASQVDLQNARALQQAMLVCTSVPWILCGTIYSALHYTYPRDKAAVQLLQRLSGDGDNEVNREGGGLGEEERLVTWSTTGNTGRGRGQQRTKDIEINEFSQILGNNSSA